MTDEERLETIFNGLKQALNVKMPNNGLPFRKTKNQTNYYIYVSECFDTSLLAVCHSEKNAKIIAKAYEDELGYQVIVEPYKSAYIENSLCDKTIEQFRKDILGL